MDETIFALSTGHGRAAIAIVRASGPAVPSILAELAGGVPRPRRAALRTIRDRNRMAIDQALVLYFPAPGSETGEDVCEFQLHGGTAVVAALLKTLSSFEGCRPADPGEFARRALRNGKMDLLDIEALGDLIDADTEAQRAQAIASGGSLLRARAESWRGLILDARAELEAEIDFSDEGDVATRLDSSMKQSLTTLLTDLDAVLEQGQRGERMRGGFRVAVIGPPNAGKSTLLNRLAGREVAIVTPQAGTTRDRIEVSLDLGGLPVIVIDTAGLRDSTEMVESIGIERALEAARTADLVLWLSADDDVPWDVGHGAVLRVRGKCDESLPSQGFGVSGTTGLGISKLLDEIEARARASLCGEPVLLTRARHGHTVRAAASHIRAAVNCAEPEICAEELRAAELQLNRLVGKVDVEDVLGAIFSRFCVGK